MPGYGQGRHRGRGRCRGRRWIEKPIPPTQYQPATQQQKPREITILIIEELEAIRLVDLEDLKQEEAAAMMGVSRKTLWNDLHRARKKIANALINGHIIHIQGGNYIQRK